MKAPSPAVARFYAATSAAFTPGLKGKTAAVLAYLKERAAAGQPWPVPQAEAALPFLPPIR